jgi:hypothetical protein
MAKILYAGIGSITLIKPYKTEQNGPSKQLLALTIPLRSAHMARMAGQKATLHHHADNFERSHTHHPQRPKINFS